MIDSLRAAGLPTLFCVKKPHKIEKFAGTEQKNGRSAIDEEIDCR